MIVIHNPGNLLSFSHRYNIYEKGAQMKLSELISILPFADNPVDYQEIEITGVEIDSRKVKPGSLFICIRGFQTDGHLYVGEAIKNGAKALIVEENVNTEIPVIQVSDTTRALAQIVNKFYQYPTAELPLIGVTGTNGKTTVTYLLEEIYQTYGRKTGVIGTIQTKLEDKVYKTNNTTPDALALQRLFKQMKEAGIEQVIMEVSSHALDIGRVYGCDFDTVIFTNLSQDHLDYHGNEWKYFYAKSLLFSRLGNTYNHKDKYAVINADDSYANELKKMTAQSVVTYGMHNKADIMATSIQLFSERTIFRLKTPLGTVKITSRLIGKFNIYNMLAASAAAIVNGVPLITIKQALEHIAAVPGRFETVQAGQDYTVIVDYAHTPDALKNILETTKVLTTGNVYLVVGCGGDRDQTKRSEMARIAVDKGDFAVFTSDNPRTEDPKDILADMTSGLDKQSANYEIEEDRKLAIEKVMSYANPGDIVVIAGKGHETYQDIAGKKLPFDDRLVARNAILKQVQKIQQN